MRSRAVLLTLSLYLAFIATGCTSKPAADNSADANNTSHSQQRHRQLGFK